MVLSGLYWLSICFIIFNTDHSVHAITSVGNVKQVYIKDLCGKTVHLQSTNLNRLLFSNTTKCGKLFTCKITFERVWTELSGKCVDYSRLQLRGFNTSLDISWKFLGTPKKAVQLSGEDVDHSNDEKDSVVCFSTLKSVVLDFNIQCDAFLDDAVSSWLYVYVIENMSSIASMSSHMTFFLDGTCYHQHEMKMKDTLILRSQYWDDVQNEVKNQSCGLRLSFSNYNKVQLCIVFLKTVNALPLGVSFQVNDFNNYATKAQIMAKHTKARLSLQGGDKFPHGETCFNVNFQRDYWFVVKRYLDIAKSGRYKRDGKTILALKLNLVEVREEYTEKEDSINEPEEEEQENEDEEGDSGLAPWIPKVLGVGAVVFGVVCCLSVVSSRRKTISSDTPSPASSRGSLNMQQLYELDSADANSRAAGAVHSQQRTHDSANSHLRAADTTRRQRQMDGIRETHTTSHPESEPMIYETPSAPPASWTETQNGGETDQNGPPPAYESVSPPPAYCELFPSSS